MTGADDPSGRDTKHAYAILNRYRSARLRNRQDILAAVSAVDEAIEPLSGPGATRHILVTAAKGYQLKGDLYMQVPMPDDALDAYEAAEQLFLRAGGQGEDFGRYLHDMAVFFMQHGLNTQALNCLLRCREVLAPYGRKYVRDADRLIAALSALQTTGDSDTAGVTAAGKPPRFRGRTRVEDAFNWAVAELNAPDPRRYAAEIATAIREAYEKFSRHGSAEDMCRVLESCLGFWWQGLDLPTWILGATAASAAAADAAARPDLLSQALAVRAACLAQQGEDARALEAVLRAVALHDEHMLALESAAFRMYRGQSGQMARAMAIELAVAAQDGALTAELVEGARLQVEPDTARMDHGGPSRSAVRGLRPVSVEGRSRLAGYYNPGIAGAPLSLEQAIATVGGPAATWWGTWAVNQAIYWALLLDGRWTCGKLSLAEGTELRSLLTRAHDASMHNSAASVRSIITGEFCRNIMAEELLSADLGRALIPAELRQRLLETGGIRPISLVIAGDFATLPPLPLLGLGDDFFSRPIRLVEAAVLRVSPPAILVDYTAGSASPAEQMHPIRLACVDPTNNLTHSRTIPPGTLVALSGTAGSDYPLASLEQLTGALSKLRRGEPGLFYYAGHAAGHSFSDDEDALMLSGETELSAHFLFSGAADSLSFPPRSMISACASSGATGGGAGEWLGLSAALLWRGGRQIVSTNWSIWDTPFTSSFELGLARRLQNAEDVAAALREAQVEALDKWRSSTHDFSDHGKDNLPGPSARLALPLIWAAYCCVGVQN